MIEAADPHAKALLAFRDALRANARLRRKYADLKAGLARQHPSNRNAYTNAKGDFIARALLLRGVGPPPRELLPE